MVNDTEKDRRINELADQFEEIWNGGQWIGANEFLTRLTGEETTWQELREELCAVEQELRRKYQQASSPGAPIQKIGNYELLERIGRGGMGEVYRARQVFLDRIDAVKVVQDKISEIPEAVERFGRELKLIGNLSHQNIVRAYGAEQTNEGKLLLAMEFVEGTSLQQLIDSGQKIPVDEAIVIIRQVAAGLQYAHEQKIVHRDIKPANIMLTADCVAKILDFGLGKFYSERSDSSGSLTKMGTPFGTLDYISPEQCRAPGGVDIRTDIYALGCTFYTIVVGEVPYPSSKFGSLPAKILAHIDQPFPSFSASGLKVSPGIEAILQKMCAKRHDQRFATPQELIDAIDEYLPANVHTGTGTTKPSLSRRWAIVAMVIACLLGSIFFFIQNNGDYPPHEPNVRDSMMSPEENPEGDQGKAKVVKNMQDQIDQLQDLIDKIREQMELLNLSSDYDSTTSEIERKQLEMEHARYVRRIALMQRELAEYSEKTVSPNGDVIPQAERPIED